MALHSLYLPLMGNQSVNDSSPVLHASSLPPTDGKAAFHIFLKSEFCEENIEFWTACEDFKALTSHKQLVSKASSIFEEFIQSESPKEVMNCANCLFLTDDLKPLCSSKAIKL